MSAILTTKIDGAVRNGVVVGDVHLDAEQFNADVARVANALRGEGIGPGDLVALLMYNDLPYLVGSNAISRLGASPVAINWHSTAEHIADVVLDSGAKVLIAHRVLWESVRDLLPADVLVVIAPVSRAIAEARRVADSPDVVEEAHVRMWAPWLEAQPTELAGAHASTLGTRMLPDTVIYTSGTTGRSKGVRRRTAPVPRPETREAMGLLGVTPGMRYVLTGPMYHVAPSGIALHVINVGGLTIVQPRFDAEELLALIDHFKITFLILVPTMLVRILRLPAEVRAAYDVSSLQRVVHTAGPCPVSVKQDAIEYFGPIITEFYGGTEASFATFCSSADSLAKPGTVGRAAPGVTLRILDESGREVPTGQIGEVFIRNVSVLDFEYLGNEQARRDVERDGFITQGDLGYLDEDGYLFLAGRRREMIVRGGVNIYNIEIENVVAELPGVRMGAVFAVPDEEFGEVVGLAVELDGTRTVSEEQVRDAVHHRLGGLKTPQVVVFDQTLSTMNDAGKIPKHVVAAKHAGARRLDPMTSSAAPTR